MTDTHFTRSGGSPPKSSRHQRRLQREYENARRAMQDAFQARDCGVLIYRSDPIATAMHEAAHCVFYEAFGITVGWASCVPDLLNGKLGNIRSNADRILLPGILHVMVDLAGDLAERPFITHEAFSPETAFMSTTDLAGLQKFFQASSFKESEYAEVYLGLARQCIALIRQSQRFIEAVAVLIYASKTAQGDAIRKVLRAKDFYRADNPLAMFKAHVMQVAARVSQQQVGSLSPRLLIPSPMADVVEMVVATKLA